MTFDDFCKHFDYLSICHRINTSIASLHKRWHDSMFHGAWLKPYRAGGCSNNLDTFFYNPQVRLCAVNNPKMMVYTGWQIKSGRFHLIAYNMTLYTTH